MVQRGLADPNMLNPKLGPIERGPIGSRDGHHMIGGISFEPLLDDIYQLLCHAF